MGDVPEPWMCRYVVLVEGVGTQVYRIVKMGNSPAVQWLRLSASMAAAGISQVQSLVGELRSRKMCSMTKKFKENCQNVYFLFM